MLHDNQPETRKTTGVDQLPSGKWRARFQANGRQRTVGSFGSQDEAIEALAKARAKVRACREAARRQARNKPSQGLEDVVALAATRVRCDSFVYFVQEGRSGPIKIGRASSLMNRLYQMQSGSSRPQQLLAIVPGGEHLERILHAIFEPTRIRGEWFRPRERLKTLAKELGSIWMPDVQEAVRERLWSRRRFDAPDTR